MKDCVSLEVAQKLQKAGYKTQGEYNWKLGDEWTLCRKGSIEDGFCYDLSIPAPTTTQLAEELKMITPKDTSGFDYTITIEVIFRRWRVAYGPVFNDFVAISGNLPDALGLMMEYLLVNKLI